MSQTFARWDRERICVGLRRAARSVSDLVFPILSLHLPLRGYYVAITQLLHADVVQVRRIDCSLSLYVDWVQPLRMHRVPEVETCQNTTTTPPTATKSLRDFDHMLAAYRGSKLWRSCFQLVSTLVLAGISWTAMYLCLSISYWLTLALALPTALLMVRLFILQHDCGHRSFFESKRANDLVGFFLGILTFTPYDCWRRSTTSRSFRKPKLAPVCPTSGSWAGRQPAQFPRFRTGFWRSVHEADEAATGAATASKMAVLVPAGGLMSDLPQFRSPATRSGRNDRSRSRS